MSTPWPTKKLGEVCEINPKFKNNLDANSEVGFLTMADVSEDAEIIRIQKRKLSEVRKGFTNFIDGDVLVAKITPCFENGKGAFVEGIPRGIGFGSTEFHILRANEDFLLNKYIYYIISDKKFRKRHAKFMTGSAGQQRVSTEFLKRIEIPLPPLKIQKQIVERMDKIAEAQKLNNELIQKADELYRSLLHNELNAKIKNQNAKSQFKNQKLGEVFERVTDTILPTKHPAEEFNFIGLENIESDTGQIINARLTKGEFIKSTKVVFRKDDTLYGKLRPYLNKVWLAEFDGICSTDIWVLRAKRDVIVPLLLPAILRQPSIVKKSSDSMVGANLPRANKNVFDNITILLPPMGIQKQIVAKLSAAQEYKKQLLEQKLKLKELFDSVLHKSMNSQRIPK